MENDAAEQDIIDVTESSPDQDQYYMIRGLVIRFVRVARPQDKLMLKRLINSLVP